MKYFPTDQGERVPVSHEQSEWWPKEGDLLDCGNREYKIYHKGKWIPISYEAVKDPSKPDWDEFINKPFRNEEEGSVDGLAAWIPTLPDEEV